MRERARNRRPFLRLSIGKSSMDRADLLCLQDQILPFVESRFGPRLPGYTLIAPDFCDRGPYLQHVLRGTSIVQLRVNSCCKEDDLRACYQLAHEAVHVLSPVSRGKETVLEEGVATFFQHAFLLECCGHREWNTSGNKKYDEARALVGELIAQDEQAILRIRKKQPEFTKITAEIILREFPLLAKEVASTLTLLFSLWNPA
jgi:hypothetical protein